MTLIEETKNAISVALGGCANTAEMRSKIMQFEAALLAHPNHMTAADFKTTHHFAPGIYMRELFIPKGVALIGKIHKTEHLNILSMGDITVWTDQGMKRLTASAVVLSQPGIKRVGFAHEDSIWITVHHNPGEERDTDKIEEMLIATSFEESITHADQKKIEGVK